MIWNRCGSVVGVVRTCHMTVSQIITYLFHYSVIEAHACGDTQPEVLSMNFYGGIIIS